MAGLVEAWVLAAALSVDAFVASFAYGSSRIRIPLVSVLIMDVVSAGTLAFSLAMGNWLQGFFPGWVTKGICFGYTSGELAEEKGMEQNAIERRLDRAKGSIRGLRRTGIYW